MLLQYRTSSNIDLNKSVAKKFMMYLLIESRQDWVDLDHVKCFAHFLACSMISAGHDQSL
jgi:hypothetical protein